MNILTAFGVSDRLYTFADDSQISYQDNFSDVKTKLIALPAMDGGFDDYGIGRAPVEIGTVQAQFWLEFYDQADLREKVDAIREMTNWGVSLLRMKPLGGAERFTWARVNNISMNQNVKDTPHKRQKVQVTWQVGDPRWFRSLSGGAEWDEGLWGSGLWGEANSTTSSISTDITDLTITHNGNTFTEVRAQIETDGFGACLHPRIQRLVNGIVVEEIRFNGRFEANELLDVDPRAMKVMRNYAPFYTSDFSFKTARWLTLEPGSNTIRLRFEDPTGTGGVTVRLYYLEAYR